MKIGIILSAVVVILFAMVLLLNRGAPATVPTLDTSPDMLALQAVPTDAPSLFTPANPQADADEAYRQALAFYQTNKNELVADPVPDALAEQWGMLFVEAANAGQVSDGFLDKESVMTPAAHGPHSFALTEAPRVVLSRAQALYEEGKQERAIAMGRAIWALGLRGYTKNLRAHERLLSLWCMEMAHDALQAWLPADGPYAAALTYWGPRLQAINQPFQKKV